MRLNNEWCTFGIDVDRLIPRVIYSSLFCVDAGLLSLNMTQNEMFSSYRDRQHRRQKDSMYHRMWTIRPQMKRNPDTSMKPRVSFKCLLLLREKQNNRSPPHLSNNSSPWCLLFSSSSSFLVFLFSFFSCCRADGWCHQLISSHIFIWYTLHEQ